MEQTMEIDIPLLLPGVTEGQDRCVERLARLLVRRDGVQSVHVRRANDEEHVVRKASAGESLDGARLCLHYDPERLTLSQVEELVELAVARVRERFNTGMSFAGPGAAASRMPTTGSRGPLNSANGAKAVGLDGCQLFDREPALGREGIE